MIVLVNPYILGTSAPSALSIASSNNNGSPTTTATASLTGVPAGALLVVCVANNSNTVDDCTVTGGSLTWTRRANAGLASGNNAEIHTAVFAAGGSITITPSWSGGLGGRMVTAFAVTGQEASLGGNAAIETGATTPSVTISTTRANSILFCITSDWNGQDGSSRTFRTPAGSSLTDQYYYHPNGDSSYYVYFYQCTTIQSYTVGMTAPGVQKAVTAVYEIRTP